jgi:hypothetical protein
MLLIEEGRWADLLGLAAGDVATPEERRELAHMIAVQAPPALAVAAAELYPGEETGFPGPLWEVVAQRPWHDLAPHLTHPRVRELVAQTRVLHGEDLRGVVASEVPLLLEPWEAAEWDPESDIPEYNATGSAGSHIWCFPHWLIENLPGGVPLPPASADPIEHPAVAVLENLNEPHKPIRAYAFRTTAWEAAATIAADRDTCRAAEVSFAQAYPHLVHLATGFGPYAVAEEGGQALGRLAVWRALSLMAGGDQVTAFVERLRCVAWRRPAEQMCFLNLAMEDPVQGLTWALTASATD